MTNSSEIARLALKRMDSHEAESYEGGGSETFDDPDGALLRYSRALRRVMALCDTWEMARTAWDPRPTEAGFRDRIRQAIGYEMGVTQAPPEGSGP